MERQRRLEKGVEGQGEWKGNRRAGARWDMGCKEGVRALVRVFKGRGKEREQESLEGVGTGEA